MIGFTFRAMRKIYGIGGLLLLLPLVISAVIASSTGEGVNTIPNSNPNSDLIGSSPSPSSTAIFSSTDAMADIPAGANTVLIAYVDALTDGLHTGKGEAIRALTVPGCACRIIAESFELIYLNSNLLGGSYRLVSATAMSSSPTSARVRVRIHLGAVIHVNRHTNVREMWGNTDIEAIFTLAIVNGKWKVEKTESV